MSMFLLRIVKARLALGGWKTYLADEDGMVFFRSRPRVSTMFITGRDHLFLTFRDSRSHALFKLNGKDFSFENVGMMFRSLEFMALCQRKRRVYEKYFQACD